MALWKARIEREGQNGLRSQLRFWEIATPVSKFFKARLEMKRHGIMNRRVDAVGPERCRYAVPVSHPNHIQVVRMARLCVNFRKNHPQILQCQVIPMGLGPALAHPAV